MDGLKIPIDKAGDIVEQNNLHNRWTSGHYVTNIFVFVPNGTIVLDGISCPSNMHDIMVNNDLGIYETLQKIYDHTGGKCIVDSAFNIVVQSASYMYKSSVTAVTKNDPQELAQNT